MPDDVAAKQADIQAHEPSFRSDVNWSSDLQR